MTSPRTWDWPRIVYGDWTWLVRDSLDVLRLAFIAATVVFAAEGSSDAAALTAASTVLLIARVVNLPRWFDFGLTVAMTLIAWGTALHLYGQWFYYDNVVHSLSPVAYAPVLYIALVRLGVVPDPAAAVQERRGARIAGIFIVTLALGMAVGAGYESVEWFEDKFDILGGHFVKGLWDTETDLLADTTGSFVGATFLTVWALRGWSSRRVTVHAVAPAASTPVERVHAGRARPASTWRQGLDATLSPSAKGLIGIAAGLLLLVWPSPVLRTVEVVVGIVLLAHAAVDVHGLRRPGPPAIWWRLLEIVAQVAVAALVLGWPGLSQVALLYALGLTAVLLGGIEAASLSGGAHTTRDRWLGGAAGAAAFIFGMAMIGTAQRGVHAVVTLVGVYLVVVGALRLVRTLRRTPRVGRAPAAGPA
jgi:uncharacterized membrane protein HdeD (DUF308 family)/uncharacterized membrane protein YjdF